MKVLVACEESQRVCSAFRALGHEVYSCDIIDCSGGRYEWHIKQDVLPLLNGNCKFTTADGTEHTVSGKWDLIIAHPPCTYLSNAGACRLYPKKGQLDQERYKKGLQAKAFFMKLYNADCEHICVENPIPSKVFEMPPYTQTIQPYEYGHPYSKKLAYGLRDCRNYSLQRFYPSISLMFLAGQAKIKEIRTRRDFHERAERQRLGVKHLRVLRRLWRNNGAVLAYDMGKIKPFRPTRPRDCRPPLQQTETRYPAICTAWALLRPLCRK